MSTIDQETFDLSVKNPNKGGEVALREPKDILREMNALDKEGVNDGFLTPFKVKRIKTTLDDYIFTADDQIIEGEVEEGKIYTEPDFNKIIEIKAREAKRVQIMLDEINQNEKTIIFCATQDHALAVRDLVNQLKDSKDPNYCQRVTAEDGARGEQYLREFQDNEKTIPTIDISSFWVVPVF